MYNFELLQREYFSLPQKECRIFSSPLQQILKIFWHPSPVDHPPAAGLKMTNPLVPLGHALISTFWLCVSDNVLFVGCTRTVGVLELRYGYFIHVTTRDIIMSILFGISFDWFVQKPP